MKAPTIDAFAGRLFLIARDEERRKRFDQMLARVISDVPSWRIDQSDSGQYYLRFTSGAHSHSSEGLGEGLVSLFFIIDSLYDSSPGSLTVIDEPELSLHPEFQRRLRTLLSELSRDRQIVYATHSPYFVSWDDVAAGAMVARVHKTAQGTQISQPAPETLASVSKLRLDANNPHVIGLDATEVFFLEDRVLLVEGQEDVVFYRRILGDLGIDMNATFFGWGVGGAAKMHTFARLLKELDYRAVAGILDADMQAKARELQGAFPRYHFACIPADDVRSKRARPPSVAKKGLVDDSGRVRPEFQSDAVALFEGASSYFSSQEDASVHV